MKLTVKFIRSAVLIILDERDLKRKCLNFNFNSKKGFITVFCDDISRSYSYLIQIQIFYI
jgi:hypothetical protein